MTLTKEGCLVPNPHDVWDEWIKKKGKGNVMEAIYPVAKTEIGNIASVSAMKGSILRSSAGLP